MSGANAVNTRQPPEVDRYYYHDAIKDKPPEYDSPEAIATRQLIEEAEPGQYDNYTDLQWHGAILCRMALDMKLDVTWRLKAALVGVCLLSGMGYSKAGRVAELSENGAEMLSYHAHYRHVRDDQCEGLEEKIRRLHKYGHSDKLISNKTGASMNKINYVLRHKGKKRRRKKCQQSKTS